MRRQWPALGFMPAFTSAFVLPLVLALLLSACSSKARSGTDLRSEIHTVIDQIGEELSGVESPEDFTVHESHLRDLHIELAKLLGELGAKSEQPPCDESIAFMMAKERLEEQLTRVRALEGGGLWLERAQFEGLELLRRFERE